MNIVDEIIDIALSSEQRFSLLWGQVISTSPTKVRIAGDTNDIAIPLDMDSYTPTTSDKVLIAQLGSTLIILGDFS